MKPRKRLAVLAAAHSSGRMVRIEQAAAGEDPIDGFVVGLSGAFALLHAFDGGQFVLQGYTALPLREIASARVRDDYDAFAERALKVKGISAQPQPDILLVDFPGLLSSADAHFPLVTVHAERLWPGTCYIGRVARLTARSVRLRKINPAARWIGTEKFRFKDVTRVDFGGGYEEALWLVNQAERLAAASGE